MPATASSVPSLPAELADLPQLRRRTCRHGPMLYSVNDVYIGRSLEIYGEYIEAEARLYHRLLQPGDVVVEAGANIGAFTVPIARRVGPSGRVHAFEPQRVGHALLRINLALNGLGHVTLHRAALGDRPGEMVVPVPDYRRPGNFGGYGLSGAGEGERVPVVTVDSLGLERCDLLKIDVQGMEKAVLDGARETVQRCRPAIHVENDRQEQSAALIDWLLRQGYRLWWHLPRLFNPANFRGRKDNVFGNTLSANVLALPEGRDATVARDLRQVRSAGDWWRQPAASTPAAAAPAPPPAPPAASPAFDAAIVAHREGRFDQALKLYDEAIAKGERLSGAFTNIGVIMRTRRQFDAAIAAHRRALELIPDDPGVLGNLGNALKDAGRFDEAIALKRRVVELRDGKDAESWHGLGIALRDAGRIAEAAEIFVRAIEISPNDPEIRFNLALAQLHLENYEEGWANYETRWQLDRQKKRAFSQPWWHGGPFTGKTLLLFAEQGFGDTIQFIRFVPGVKALGGTVVLECQKELVRLMQSVPGLDRIVVRDTAEAETATREADLVCPLASLPGICKATTESLPGVSFPYLVPPEGTGKKFDALLARAGDRLRVGIVWSGSITFADNANRSAGLAPYLRFAAIPGVQLFGLQKGPRLEELKALGTDSLIIDASPLLDDFADTAALIQRLDLVLMTDSSVTHLTGALGCPIWVMLMHHPDWRWLRERTDSPWYPSVRLFRQRTPRDWEHVFSEVEKALTELAASRPRRVEAPAPKPPPADLVVAAALTGPDGKPRFTMPIPARFRDDPGLRVLAREELQDGGFEYGTRRFLDDHLAPGDLFIDVGAHWGVYSLSAATRWPGQVNVLAIEASPLNVEQLRRWIAHNGQEKQIEVVAAGAADREGFASVAPQSTMGHHLTHLGEEAGGGEGIRIPVTTIDRLLADRPALQGRRTLVKIDVEGLEPEVIEGAADLLRSGRVSALIFEKGRNYNTAEGRPRLVALCERLRGLGFSLWRLPHENMGGPLVPLAMTHDLCNAIALAPGFVQRPDYAKPFGTCPPPFRLPWKPTEDEQVAETEAVIAVRGALVDRWAVPEQGQAAALRASAAADELPLATSVVDLGAGAMLLRERLDPGCRYLPVDLFRFAPDMVLMDLERAPLATLGRFDAAAVLSVLEYLHDPQRLLAGIAEIADQLVLTYPLAGAADPVLARRRRGLVNDLDEAGLTGLVGRTGWQLARRRPLADGATLFLLERG
jgi:FkbM family methyltransferase